ncbi:MAG: ATP synthase F1 subunit epsilon [Flavobacteriales bacterium]
MNLEIITPDKKLYEGEVKSIQLPGLDGSFGVLDNHAPLISALQKGKINIVDKAQASISFEVNGGVVEVNKNKVIVLAE